MTEEREQPRLERRHTHEFHLVADLLAVAVLLFGASVMGPSGGMSVPDAQSAVHTGLIILGLAWLARAAARDVADTWYP